MIPHQLHISEPQGWNPEEYALIDSGNGYKLEQFGKYILARPEPQAIWTPSRPLADWEASDARFSREGDDTDDTGKNARWITSHPVPESWPIHWEELTFLARLTPFKHTGIFPEQAAQWRWIQECISSRNSQHIKMLNLFGYTGIASLVAAKAGAQVTHLDASQKILEWARENQNLSGLSEAPIRWLVDDAFKFVRREARRDVRYDLIIMDPPAFGRGPKGEVWKFESSLPTLLEACRTILSDRPLGILINSYSLRASALLLGNLLADMMQGHRSSGTIEIGELVIPSHRPLSLAIYARWTPVM
jgi:23S rRNA (cytosine1962-C5)-methyltransferase